MQEQSIFIEAMELEDAAARAAFLDRACAGDDSLRERVERLLARHEQDDSFLQAPVATLPVSASADSLGTLIGPYKLLEQIGEGGFGLVYMAEQQQPVRRKVALKILKPGMDTRQVIARFEAERQALALMDHPNIARVFDAGASASGRPYFVMELVRGIPITEYCDDKQLTTRERLELFISVCQAVQHAHQKGIIHRDLKPSNVLVSPHDGVPVVKIIDFGIAKALGQQLTDKTLFTGFAQLIGTPLYMAPEQAELNAVDIDTRSDVYSLGVLLYELLTGMTPFDQERLKTASFDEIRRIIREEEPPRPSTRLSTMGQLATTVSEQRKSDPRRLNQLFRGELDWLVMKALEKDRNRRYESANAFAADVGRYLKDEPVQACPPSAAYKLRKFARRNRASLIFTGCGILLLTVFAGTVGGFLREQTVRRGRVESEVKLALRDAELFQQQKKWPEALVAAKRALGLLQAGTSNQALRQIIEEQITDLTLAAQLEQLFGDGLARLAERAWSTLSDPEMDARYHQAFQNAGLDMKELSVAAVAAAIHRRRIRPEIVGGLDYWISIRRYAGGEADPFWKKLQQVANTLDPEPFRVLLRKAVSWTELGDDFKRIQSSPELVNQPLSALMAFAMPVVMFDKPKWSELLHQLHRRHPDDFWINFELGSDQSAPADSLRFSTAAVALRPDNAGARAYLGDALRRLGRLDEAIAETREAVRLRPQGAGPRINLGNLLSDKGLHDEAIAEYREALRVEPDHSSAALALNGLGTALCSQGKLAEGMDYFREAIKRNPNHDEAHVNLGVAYQAQGKLEQAASQYRSAIRINANNANAHYNLGAALQGLGQNDDALRHLRVALDLEPNHAGGHNSLAWLLATCADASMRDPAAAVRHARKAVELMPAQGGSWNTLGVAQYRAGAWKAAIKALEKSMDLQKGGDASDYCFLAMAHWQLGDQEYARKWYDQAVQWMRKNKSNSEELLRFRAEAAQVLRIKE